VANALEAAALEAGLVVSAERVLPEALHRLVVARRSDSSEGRVLSISEAAEMLEVTRGHCVCVDRVQAVAGLASDAPGSAHSGVSRLWARVRWCRESVRCRRVIGEPEAAWGFS